MFDKKNLKAALRLYAVTDNAWLGERTPVSYTHLTLPTILRV